MRMLDPFENEKLIYAGYLLSGIGFISYFCPFSTKPLGRRQARIMPER
ncbi:hypothetical protein [Methanosarcina horonobensis]|nr:hypothetical protein [Methanosarcina horonobensis]